MKKQAYMIIAAIILATVTSLSSAQAQTSGDPTLVANIPFDFTVGDKTLPAGAYSVRVVNPASSGKVLQIRRQTGSESALVRTDSVIGKMKDNALLIFHKYGDEYFFAQAWMPSEEIGMKAPKSRRAKAHELASATKTTKTVLAKVGR